MEGGLMGRKLTPKLCKSFLRPTLPLCQSRNQLSVEQFVRKMRKWFRRKFIGCPIELAATMLVNILRENLVISYVASTGCSFAKHCHQESAPVRGGKVSKGEISWKWLLIAFYDIFSLPSYNHHLFSRCWGN